MTEDQGFIQIITFTTGGGHVTVIVKRLTICCNLGSLLLLLTGGSQRAAGGGPGDPRASLVSVTTEKHTHTQTQSSL